MASSITKCRNFCSLCRNTCFEISLLKVLRDSIVDGVLAILLLLLLLEMLGLDVEASSALEDDDDDGCLSFDFDDCRTFSLSLEGGASVAAAASRPRTEG